jgi:hypothetical protein
VLVSAPRRNNLSFPSNSAFEEKFAMAGAPSPAGEAPALPRHLRAAVNERAGAHWCSRKSHENWQKIN